MMMNVFLDMIMICNISRSGYTFKRNISALRLGFGKIMVLIMD